MEALRRIAKARVLRRLSVVLALYLLYTAWLWLAAPGKIHPAVGEVTDDQGRVNVEVVLRFPPERFHILRMQEHGRIRRTTGNVIELHRAPMEDVRRIARIYWVAEIRPAPEDEDRRRGSMQPIHVLHYLRHSTEVVPWNSA